MENKNSNNSILICIISLICGALIMFILCYFNIIKVNIQSTDKRTEQESSNEIKNDCTPEIVETAAKCYGTYYGEYTTTENNLTLDLKYTYILSKDGTFTADFGGVSKTSGVFTINDNTISLIGKKEVAGPIEYDPMYSTEDYVIADDCSYIIITTGTSQFKVNKK